MPGSHTLSLICFDIYSYEIRIPIISIVFDIITKAFFIYAHSLYNYNIMLIFLHQFYYSSSFTCHVSPATCTSKQCLIPYNSYLFLLCHSQNFPLTVSIKFSKPFFLVCNSFFMIFSMSVFLVGVFFTTSLLLPYPW